MSTESKTTDSTQQPKPRPDHFARVGDSAAATHLANLLEKAVAPPYRIARELRLTDLLHGTIPLKHPAHPALSDLPVGLYIAAVLAYAFQQWTAGIIMSIAGVVGALGAAATGLADWSVSDGRDKRLGAIHGTINVLATGLAIASCVLYYTTTHVLAFAFIAAALAVTGIAAYLGGHLVFDRALMVNLAAIAPEPQLDWTKLMTAEALLPGHAKAVEVGHGRTVIVHRSASGQLSCIQARCVHAGGPLQEGAISHGKVTCPWHQSVFDLSTGAVLRGPASRPQPTLLTRVAEDGYIEVADPQE